MTTLAGITELQNCLSVAAVLEDPLYYECMYNAGVLNTETCAISCETSTTACCGALNVLKNCQANTAASLSCKDQFDYIFDESLQCSLGAGALLMILTAIFVFIFILILLAGKYSVLIQSNFIAGLWVGTRQVRNLVWKNFKLKFRRPIALLLEQSLPLFLMLVLVIVANLDYFQGEGSSTRKRALVETYENQNHRRSLQSITACSSGVNTDVIDAGMPSDTLESFYSSIQPVLGMFFILCYIKFVASLSSSMVMEKEMKTREVMKMMGLNDGPLVASWYITYFLIYSPLALAITVETKYGNVFPKADFAELLFFFLMWGYSIVSFCYMITPFFNKSKAVATASILIWIIMYFPFYRVGNADESVQFLAALLPPTAFGLGINFLVQEAQRGTGFYYALSTLDAPIDGVNAVDMAFMLLVDTVLMLALGWYFDKVIPQEYGVPRPYNFIFQRSYWKVGKSYSHKNDEFFSAIDSSNHVFVDGLDSAGESSKIEPVDRSLLTQVEKNECVMIRGLRKVFKVEDGERVAVNNLSLNLYSGQILALLGINGAGKSTTLAMLTGLLPPTTGDAIIFGNSIKYNMPDIRRHMGVCPQHDVLYDELTVKEHLQFYAAIKGVPEREVDSEVRNKILEVGLTEKVNTFSKSLSGGQKRKLSVAIALIGDSRIVFLDEPTSGMDPYSRRFMWNLLRKSRKNRVIVLTTHFMDEADLLGDRIAILSKGELCCAGSSLFLKRRYGAGYNLSIVKSPHCDIKLLLKVVSSIIPAANVLSNAGSEVILQLPVSEKALFPVLFTSLNSKKHSLGILEYGVSVTTLEAVFLRIAKDNEVFQPQLEAQKYRESRIHRSSARQSHLVPSNNLRLSLLQQYGALLLKRARHAKRDKKGFTFSILIPVFFLCILAFLPNISVASYLPIYQNTSTQSQENYDECVNLLNTDTQTFQCAFGLTSGDVCDDRCQPSRVTCRKINCSNDFSVSETSPELPYCPASDSHVPAQNLDACQSEWYSFCSLGLIDCDPSDCCDSGNIKSPYFPCSSCDSNTWACYTQTCLRKSDAQLQGTINTFIASLVIVIAFSFIPSAIIVYVVKEKDAHQNAKHQQLVSGLSIYMYWISLYTWDLLSTIIPIAVCLIFIPTYSSFRNDSESLTAAAVLLGLFALSSVPLSYIVSFKYQQHAAAQSGILVFFLVTGAIFGVISYVFRLVEFTVYGDITLAILDTHYLKYFYLIFPGYALQDGIFQVGLRKFGSPYGSTSIDSSCPESNYCWDRYEEGCCNPGAFEYGVAGQNMLYLAIESTLFLILVFIMDGRQNNPSSKLFSPGNQEGVTRREIEDEQERISQEDSDVHKERLRVYEGRAKGDRIVLDSLRKVYVPKNSEKKKIALKNLSIGIPVGECFGYLGVNGAGKTSTMKILTGNIIPSGGGAYVGGFNVSKRQKEARKLIGYCPQFDALFDYLTVREHLEFYANVKGVQRKHIKRTVDEKISELDLTSFRNKLSKGLSGGNKRKLSTAIALIGNPSIVFLDEPSTGMDPLARRKMWDVISSICENGGCTVILTTHSMEECEALCSRVGILVSGRLKCLGSVQHLKSKYGQGYTINLKLEEPKKQRITQIRLMLLEALAHYSQKPVQDYCSSETQNVQVSSAMLKNICFNFKKRYKMIVNGEGSAWIFSQYLDLPDGKIPLDTLCSWWVQQDSSIHVEQMFSDKFKDAQLVERHGNHFTYQLGRHEAEIGEVFSVMENCIKDQLGISEYDVSDTTLEQIFNNFASEQEEEFLRHGFKPSSIQALRSTRRSGSSKESPPRARSEDTTLQYP